MMKFLGFPRQPRYLTDLQPIVECAVLAVVPEPQDDNPTFGKFVAQLVLSDCDTPHFAWFIGFELFADSGKIDQLQRRAREVLDHPRRRRRRHRREEIMQADEIASRLARPLDLQGEGGGNGVSVDRLSAHAWT